MAIEESTIAAEQIEVLADGSLQVRDTTIILRDGLRDMSFPPKFHRYVLHPGAGLADQPERVLAVAGAVWTEEVVEAWIAGRGDG